MTTNDLTSGTTGRLARAALVAGATGLVGRELLALLLADPAYGAVHTVGRRAPAQHHPKVQHHAMNFITEPSAAALPALDDVFIALGTTIKVAGSQAAFRAVDFDAVLSVARAARQAGATRLGLVSAMGADAASRIFYSRVKGEVEAAVSRLGFTSVVIARPSMLHGDRGALDQPERRGEQIALNLSRWLRPLIPANYMPIAASQVARALVQAVCNARPGVSVLLSGELQRA